MLAHLDLPVMRLIRVAFGPIHLGELRARQVDEVPAQALDNLLGVRGRRARRAGPSPSHGRTPAHAAAH